MKNIQKYLYILVCTIALLCIIIYITPKPDMPLPTFLVQSPAAEKEQEISIYSPGDGNYYVFLPSYTSLEMVTISLPANHHFSLGDLLLSDGMSCGDFELEIPYTFTVDNRQVAELRFLQSANVPTMYIDTFSGNMKYLHQDKKHKENVSVSLYTVDGKTNYSDEVSVLSGRGNGTWEYDKRPYTLTLPADNALLDMKPATNWILLANAADETNLNNKLILDLASRVCPQWTPETRWVDLYLNGEYSGLYLLTEKVEVHDSRLSLDADAGEFLCRVDIITRWNGLNNPFFSYNGRTVELAWPQYTANNQQAEIEYQVGQLEDIILSGADLRSYAAFDLDSWVRRYLIDEISANIDSDLASCYFYYSDGKFFAGPLWDYDMTLGNHPRNHSPSSFVAKNGKKTRECVSLYYRALYSNASFYSRMLEIYRTEFLPELQKMENSEIDRLIDHIHQAARCNSLRWRSMYDNLPADVVHTPSALKDYFSQRIRFLNSAWLENTPYCTIQFEHSYNASLLSVSVEKGQLFESSYINTNNVIWCDIKTGEVFDFSQPVMEDAILTKQITDSES